MATPNRRWVGFFVVLALLSLTAMVLPIVYNLGQQLRREQWEAARQRWQERALRDYDLTFRVKLDRDLAQQRHVVRVRAGRVVVALVEGQVVFAEPALSGAIGLPFASATDAPPWSMEQIFAHLETLLREQEASGGRHFLVAVFDPSEGWPRRFVRRNRQTNQREEWDLKLWRVGELEAEAARYR
jgi:hypothetical protein